MFCMPMRRLRLVTGLGILPPVQIKCPIDRRHDLHTLLSPEEAVQLDPVSKLVNVQLPPLVCIVVIAGLGMTMELAPIWGID